MDGPRATRRLARIERADHVRESAARVRIDARRAREVPLRYAAERHDAQLAGVDGFIGKPDVQIGVERVDLEFAGDVIRPVVTDARAVSELVLERHLRGAGRIE